MIIYIINIFLSRLDKILKNQYIYPITLQAKGKKQDQKKNKNKHSTF